ncbi:MAG: prenyltransferase/squalene oxidase repeat-containing protein [Planctomycetota bacterium]
MRPRVRSSRAAVAMVAAGVGLNLASSACENERPSSSWVGSFATAWLLSQQREDGAFASPAYGVLRAAHSTTAFAAYALARSAGRPPKQTHACQLALQFLRAAGVAPATQVDYPCYTAAYWILAARALGDDLAPELRAGDVTSAVAFLRRHQLVEGRGWTTDDPEYGGFGYGVDAAPKPAERDAVGMSTTRVAVEALVAAGVTADDPALCAARRFVERCQVWAPDQPERHGGFVFQPGDGPLASKAGRDDRGPLPYASATCDGLLALTHLGQATSPRAQAAMGWLRRHVAPPTVAGFEASDARHRPYEEGLRLYALAALRAAIRVGPEWWAREWGPAIVAAVASRQGASGAIVGWSPLLKEDDRLVATVLGLLALDG